MKVTFPFLLSAFLSAFPAPAAPLQCDFVAEDGKEQAETVVTLDPQKGLLEMQGRHGGWQMPVLTESSVFPYNAPALQFNRRKECQVSSALAASGAVGFHFTCSAKEGVGLDANFEIAADGKSASYSGAILARELPGQRFIAIFRGCR